MSRRNIGMAALWAGRSVALMATLVFSFFPAVGVLKVTGPCGKALCTCRPVVSRTYDAARGAWCEKCEAAKAVRRLMPADAPVNPGSAPLPSPGLRLLVPDAVLLASTTVMPAQGAARALLPAWRRWAGPNPAYDVPHPPPRG